MYMSEPVQFPSPPSRNRAGSVLTPTPATVAPTLEAMMGKRHPSTTATHPASTSQYYEKVTPMLHPSDPELRRPLAVRGGQSAPVTCAACGCRLAATGDAWFHFNPLGGRDARGCRVACADAAHDATGRAISVNV
jgi:hypothetical protein